MQINGSWNLGTCNHELATELVTSVMQFGLVLQTKFNGGCKVNIWIEYLEHFEAITSVGRISLAFFFGSKIFYAKLACS